MRRGSKKAKNTKTNSFGTPYEMHVTLRYKCTMFLNISDAQLQTNSKHIYIYIKCYVPNDQSHGFHVSKHALKNIVQTPEKRESSDDVSEVKEPRRL